MTTSKHNREGRGSRRIAVRRGALLLELVASVALFSVTLTVAVPVVVAVAAMRDQSQCRQLAGIELANVMERIAAGHRAGKTVSAAASSISLDPEAAKVLEGAELTVVAAEWNEVPRGVHVMARLSWLNAEGQPAAPAELHGYFVDRPTAEAPQ